VFAPLVPTHTRGRAIRSYAAPAHKPLHRRHTAAIPHAGVFTAFKGFPHISAKYVELKLFDMLAAQI
jgi:hypothetical protein